VEKDLSSLNIEWQRWLGSLFLISSVQEPCFCGALLHKRPKISESADEYCALEDAWFTNMNIYVFIYTYIHVNTCVYYKCVCVWVYVWVCVCMCACLRQRWEDFLFTMILQQSSPVLVGIYVCIYIYIYIYIYVYICIYKYTYIYTYIYIYIRIYIYI